MEDKENNPVEAGGDVDMEDMGVRPAGGKRVRQAAYVARSTRVAPGCDATSLESGQVAVAQDSEAPESEPAEEIPDKYVAKPSDFCGGSTPDGRNFKSCL